MSPYSREISRASRACASASSPRPATASERASRTRSWATTVSRRAPAAASAKRATSIASVNRPSTESVCALSSESGSTSAAFPGSATTASSIRLRARAYSPRLRSVVAAIEVEGEYVRELLDPVGEQLFDRETDLRMGLAAAREKLRLVGHLLHERVAERVSLLGSKFVRCDESLGFKGGKRRADRANGRDSAEHARPEGAADDGRSLHDPLRLRVESVELRLEEILDRRRNTGRATRDERADDFLDEERISAGPLEDERANIWVERPPGHAIHHRARLFAGQWLD